MDVQSQVREAMREKLQNMRVARPSFSLRSFSRLIRLSPATTSQFLSGKRRLSQGKCSEVIDRLDLAADRRHALLRALATPPDPVGPRLAREAEVRIRLRDDQFEAIASPEHFAILAYLQTSGPGRAKTLEGAARSLGISLAQARAAFARLKRIGVIKVTRAGQYRLTSAPLETTDEIASAAIRRFHSEQLDLARASLTRDAVEKRDFCSLTMAIDPRKLGRVKRLIREFRDQLGALLESGERTHVYHLSLQLYPLGGNP